MINHKRYLYIIAGLILLISVIIYYDLEKENSGNKEILWNENWSAIEYGLFRFEKDKNFSGDEYYVIEKSNLLKNKSSDTLQRRRASYIVANYFNSWNKPPLKGVYEDSMADSIKGDDVEQKEILFYKNKYESDPVRVIILKKMPDGRVVFKIQNYSNEKKIYILGGEYFNSFDAEPASFREKRIFLYPSDSYTENLRLEFHNQKVKITLVLNQTRTKTQADLIQKWSDDSGKEIPLYLGSALDSHLRQLQVETFADEENNSSNIQSLWETPGDLILLNLKMKYAGELEVEIKKIVSSGNEMVLVKHGRFIDYMNINHWNNIQESAKKIIDFSRLKSAEKPVTRTDAVENSK